MLRIKKIKRGSREDQERIKRGSKADLDVVLEDEPTEGPRSVILHSHLRQDVDEVVVEVGELVELFEPLLYFPLGGRVRALGLLETTGSLLMSTSLTISSSTTLSTSLIFIIKKHHHHHKNIARIAKRCPENISSVVKVSKTSY